MIPQHFNYPGIMAHFQNLIMMGNLNLAQKSSSNAYQKT